MVEWEEKENKHHLLVGSDATDQQLRRFPELLLQLLVPTQKEALQTGHHQLELNVKRNGVHVERRMLLCAEHTAALGSETDAVAVAVTVAVAVAVPVAVTVAEAVHAVAPATPAPECQDHRTGTLIKDL